MGQALSQAPIVTHKKSANELFVTSSSDLSTISRSPERKNHRRYTKTTATPRNKTSQPSIQGSVRKVLTRRQTTIDTVSKSKQNEIGLTVVKQPSTPPSARRKSTFRGPKPESAPVHPVLKDLPINRRNIKNHTYFSPDSPNSTPDGQFVGRADAMQYSVYDSDSEEASKLEARKKREARERFQKMMSTRRVHSPVVE